MTETAKLLEISPAARRRMLDERARHDDPRLALWIEISGVAEDGFRHRLGFRPVDDADGDHVEHHGELAVVLPADRLDDLEGTVVDVDDDHAIVVDNPNMPSSPQLEAVAATELTGDVEDRVRTVIEEHVNPSLAVHRGRAELAAVQGSVAHILLRGGCQGCGLASLTLTAGITETITRAVPEIDDVVDVTDHSQGTSPFYAPAPQEE